MQSIDSIETHAYATSKDLVSDKEEIKCSNIIKQYKKMIIFDDIIKKYHNPNWPKILDDPYRISIIGGSGSGKTNLLFNLINRQPDTDRILMKFRSKFKFKI